MGDFTFMPHGTCYLWNPWIIGLHVVSDVLIAVAYFSIPLTLLYFVRRRRDLEFSWMFVCFATFIIACGLTHVMEVWSVWRADYLVSGIVKAVTAAASVPTAILLLLRVVPAALRLPSPALLRATNEALAKSNRDLEHFAHIASHDLREPLRRISSYCELLRRDNAGKLSANSERYLATVIEGTARMDEMLKSLLTYSQVSSHELRAEPVSLGSVVTQVQEALQLQLTEAGATVEADALPTVTGDPVQLAQLLQNLVSNAVKFRGDKVPHVKVSAAREGADWLITVADNGAGIAPEHFNRLFRMFERLPQAKGIAGTGVGLAVCQRIVERHGGRIWIESTLGHGTRFHFTLPLKPRRMADELDPVPTVTPPRIGEAPATL